MAGLLAARADRGVTVISVTISIVRHSIFRFYSVGKRHPLVAVFHRTSRSWVDAGVHRQVRVKSVNKSTVVTVLDIHHLVERAISGDIIAFNLKELAEATVFSHMRHASVLAEVLDDDVSNVCLEAPLEVGGIVQHGFREDVAVCAQVRGLYDCEEFL
jgi:hypothetical protein